MLVVGGINDPRYLAGRIARGVGTLFQRRHRTLQEQLQDGIVTALPTGVGALGHRSPVLDAGGNMCRVPGPFSAAD